MSGARQPASDTAVLKSFIVGLTTGRKADDAQARYDPGVDDLFQGQAQLRRSRQPQFGQGRLRRRFHRLRFYADPVVGQGLQKSLIPSIRAANASPGKFVRSC